MAFFRVKRDCRVSKVVCVSIVIVFEFLVFGNFSSECAASVVVVDQLEDGETILSREENLSPRDPTGKTTCHRFGCVTTPLDMYDDDERRILETLKVGEEGEPQRGDDSVRLTKATLTLTGQKGGYRKEQINQDRSFVVSPFALVPSNENDYYYLESDNSNAEHEITGQSLPSPNLLLGVFDGHARLGEVVSQYALSTLPPMLSSKLYDIYQHHHDEDDETSVEDLVRKAFVDSFVAIDRAVPTKGQGGCTASVVLRIGPKVYVANAGDSRSFVAVYNNDNVEIVYLSREDKPDLPEERKRVERMGGSVYLPPDESRTSRVLYLDSDTGRRSGLAMSRSLGDWDAGKVGVIAEPLVGVVNLRDYQPGLSKDLETCAGGGGGGAGGDEIDRCVDSEEASNHSGSHVFAVSATDGMFDYVSPERIAKVIAESLYGYVRHEDGSRSEKDDASSSDSESLMVACEKLVVEAALEWHKDNQGKYRDDIAIAVAELG